MKYRMSNRTKQNNKRADREMESDDSPEIPDKEKACLFVGSKR